ncbi:MAG: hypothetical protein F4213_22640 [Boseongicola sp. SB0677_bin_26]|nr:hypothetical protein [Boseongicola sp. SB0677_bin_26]
MIRPLIEVVTLSSHGDHAHVGMRKRTGTTGALDVFLKDARHPTKRGVADDNWLGRSASMWASLPATVVPRRLGA